MQRFLDRGELSLLVVTVVFQLVSLITLFRVATGIASVNPGPSPPVLVVPKSLNQSVVVPKTTPQFQNPVGNSLDASFLTVLGFVIANVIVISILAYLYRKKRMKLFSILISVFLMFNVTELYFSFLFGLFSLLPLIFAAVASVLTIIAAFYGTRRIVSVLSLCLALELGSSFPILLQTPLNWIIPAVYAVFDIYAIYFGKLGKLVTEVSKSENRKLEAASEEKVPMVKEHRGISLKKWPDFGLLSVGLPTMEVGMADIAFYTMVPTVALVLKNLFAFIVVMATVDLGLLISFYLFRNKEVSPGLPIPILSGLVVLFFLMIL